MSNATVSNEIFKYIASLGVDRVFLVPGGGNMFLVDAAGTEKNIEVVVTHNEQAAVIAAEYYGRKTGKIGVAVVTTGPGSSNAVTGIAGAYFDSVPLLVLAGQVKSADYNFDGKLRQKGPQEIDLVSMVTKITKMAKTCFDIGQVSNDLEVAIKSAVSGRAGPVVLEIPLDVQSASAKWTKVFQDDLKTMAISSSSSMGNENIVKVGRLVINKIADSKRPLILVGHGVKTSQQVDSLRDLLRANRVPVVLSWPTFDFLPFDDELNAGRVGVVAKRYSNIVLQKSDYILVLGSRLDNIQTAFNIERFGKNAVVDVIDIDTQELEKMPDRFGCYECDLRDFVPALSNLDFTISNSVDRENWIKEIASLKDKYGFEVFKSEASDHGRVSIYDFIECLSDSFSGGEVLVTGSSGLAIEVFYTHFRNKVGQWVSLTTGLGAMGYGLPAALGVLSASKDKVYLFESDGSLMMNLQELQSIKTMGRPITIFLQNNDGYASIRSTQENYFNSRFVGTGPSSGLDIPSIEKIALAFGFDYLSISSLTDIGVKLEEAISHNGLLICEVLLQRDEKLMPKCSVLRTSDNKFLSAPLEDMSPLLPFDELESIMGDQIDPMSKKIRNC